jgi:hypothetical protein
MIQTTLDLTSLAFDEEIYPVVLLLKDGEESILEICGLFLTSSRNRYRFAFAWSGAVLDEKFYVVIVNVICIAWLASSLMSFSQL